MLESLRTDLDEDLKLLIAANRKYSTSNKDRLGNRGKLFELDFFRKFKARVAFVEFFWRSIVKFCRLEVIKAK